MKKQEFKTSYVAKLGIMAAVACVLGFIRFPLIPAVSFLTYDFADLPIIITSFAYGPIAGLICTVIVSFIQAFLLGGDGIYGFIMHVLSSGIFVIISASIYCRKKTKKRAIISLVIAVISTLVVMAAANYFITPFYMGGSTDYLVTQKMVLGLLPMILLFNLIKWILNSVITFFLYKRISPFLHKSK